MPKNVITTSLIIIFSLLSCQNSNKNNSLPTIKEPVFAGSFYPSNTQELKEMINGFLNKVKVMELKNPVLGLIVPHAGYVYSGQVASYGYKLLEKKNYQTIILLGGAHRYPLRYPSLYRQGAWKTPLGIVQIDSNLANQIMNDFPEIKFIPEAYAQEHSLEVQLPFLQTVLKNNFKIIPILLSDFDINILHQLAGTIYNIIKDKSNVLIVVSSDLSHYPDYQKGKKVDSETMNLIKSFKINELIKREKQVQNSQVPNLVTYQCGLAPIVTLLFIAQKFKEAEVELLEYKNSGDVSWIKERIVGYSAMAITTKNYNLSSTEDSFSLSKEEKEFLLDMARKTMEEYIINKKIPKFDITYLNLKKNAGAFVTLNKNHDLRGCIGYIAPIKPLYQSVIDNAVNASTKDYRFPPVTKEELKEIEIEISVLTPPVPVKSYNDIILGTHGIILKKGFNQAVFLPQVAPEQGWDLSTTLNHLSMKAGLGQNDWKQNCQFEVFTAIVFHEQK